MYDNGKGVRQDKVKAIMLYKQACDGRDAMGCFNLGLMYSKGQILKQNLVKSKFYVGKACDLGHQRGCEAYKKLNEQGISSAPINGSGDNITDNFKNAMTYYKAENFSQALIYFEKSCNDGKFISCNNAGGMYRLGEGTTKNHQSALNLFEKACNGKTYIGCYNLAEMNLLGQEVKINKNTRGEGFKLLIYSCDTGNHGLSCYKLGTLSENAKDEKMQGLSQFYFKKSCKLGHKESCGKISTE
ncbi:MAG: hypothetical protein DRQ51_01045 [Gammaproteobacteria bacterium]|nr:MAG: hypothetical protein DRQ51_01045 [Gammaproteobacteria bacterium]